MDRRHLIPGTCSPLLLSRIGSGLFVSVILLLLSASLIATAAANEDDAEKRQRDELERTHGSAPGTAPTPALSSAPRQPSGAGNVSDLISAFDWDAAFRNAGPPSQDLRLTLAAPVPHFQPWDSSPLYIGLENLLTRRRVLSELSTLGSLHTTEGIFLRVRGVAAEVVVPKGYAGADSKKEYQPLEIEGFGRLFDLTDFASVVAASGGVFDLIQSESQVSVRAEIPALGLVSNEVTISTR
jgi:hypothetical protein